MSEHIVVYNALDIKEALGIVDKYSITYGVLSGDVELPNAMLMKRDDVETNFNYIQPIPNACIVTIKDNEVHYLTHIRSNGKESRLKNKRSIYFGGHVDKEDIEKSSTGYIVECLVRELEEELNINDKHIYEQIIDNVCKGCIYYIYSSIDDVSKVHICLGMFLEVDEDLPTMSAETGRLEWVKLMDLIKEHETGEYPLDTWSEIMVKNLQLTQGV